MAGHRCFACDPANDERIVQGSGKWIISVPRRFVGPPGRAHGGVLIGSLTCPALQAAAASGIPNPTVTRVTGRLNAPAPLESLTEVSVAVEGDAYRVQLEAQHRVLVSALVKVASHRMAGAPIQECPPELVADLAAMAVVADCGLDNGPTLRQQTAARAQAAGLKPIEHECFGCCEGASALQLHPRVTGPDQVWTRWPLEPGFRDAEGGLATTMAVAALDCYTGLVARAHEPDVGVELLKQGKVALTGTQDVRFLRICPFEVSGGYRMVARFKGLEGRKLRGLAALFDSEGTAYALAESTWIVMDIPREMRAAPQP